MPTDTELVAAVIAALLFGALAKSFSTSIDYLRYFNKKSVEKEYMEFLAVRHDPARLIILLLEMIARTITVCALFGFGALLLFEPGNERISYGFKYALLTFMGAFFFLLIAIALSKPINFGYALRKPQKYEQFIRKKLGKLPDDPANS